MTSVLNPPELKPVWDMWFWIEKLENNRVLYDDKYDKHLLAKVKKIMPLLDKYDSEWRTSECALDEYVEKHLYTETRIKRFHVFDVVKSVIHNDILRINGLEPRGGDF